MKKLLVGLCALVLTVPVFARSHGHHHYREWRGDRGGHYVGGQGGSSHKGGHYVNRHFGHHYARHHGF